MRIEPVLLALLLLLGLPTVGIAQTVTISSLLLGKEQVLGVRSLGLKLEVLNEMKAPIVARSDWFYLEDNQHKKYPSLARLGSSDVSFNGALNPGRSVTQQLWFEIPTDLDWQTLSLIQHAPDAKDWNDYIELPLGSPTPATAPMWHPARPGDQPDPRAYGNFKDFKDLTAPRLVHAPDPQLPPGTEELLKRSQGQITSVVSLIVDNDGNPQQVQLKTPAGTPFDAEGLRTVKRYHFQPATAKDGAPMPVKVNVKVTFRLR